MKSVPTRFVSLRRVVAVGLLATAIGLDSSPVMSQLCVHSQGYWKTHVAEWAVDSLVLGSPSTPAHTYSKSALLAILNTNVKNDASLTLAYQLIAAKLSVASGSDPAPVQSTLANADELLAPFAGKLPYRVQQNSPTGRAMVAAAKVLEDYNLGRIAGSCPAPNAPPAANAGGPYAGVAGQALAFDGSGSRDPDGDSLAFAWTFGDGGSAVGATPSHTFAATGQFTVVLTVSDGRGGTATATTSATISPPPPPNRNPVANANGPYTANAGDVIQFSSGGSSDPDNDSLSYTWDFGDGGTSTAANPAHTYQTAGPYTVRLSVADGRGGSGTATAAVTITSEPPANRDPVANANGPYGANAGEAIQFSSGGSSDPDNDSLSYAWDFGDGGKSSDASPQHTYATAGPYTATLTVSDGRGGSGTDTAEVTVATTTPVTLQSLAVEPRALRFSELNATAQFAVTGHYSDGSERNLTSASTGTTYSSAAGAVATAGAEGLVTAVGNGTTDIAVANGGFSETVSVAVEEGVVLQALELSPPVVTLRELAATAPTTLRGGFSDGSFRDLTTDAGTTYTIEDTAVARTSGAGLLTAVAPGATLLTARYGGLSATTQVRVILTEASGFIRGEVYDDTRGLPLAQTTATVLMGGGAALAAPTLSPADDRGRFMLPAVQGTALVRVERSGFTAVERQANVASNAVVTLLDSRLTPLDGRVNSLQSIFGGEAASADGIATLSIPSGSLESDVTLRVTPISNQGLQGVLPLGWSPIAAVDLQPAGRRFTQGATLRLPHVDTLPAGVPVTMARYDAVQHRWVVQAAGQVSNDRRTLSADIDLTGQFAFLVPDESPAIPPVAVPGQALAGITPVAIPDSSTADGEVVPRSAPPGDGAKAIGTVMLQPPAPLPSGMVLRARVTEQFDLLDTSRVLPLHFVQDLVLYARPRLGAPGSLATRLPITPSLQFSIHQLSLGTVRLDVTIDEPASADSIVGDTGGSITDPAGNVLAVPPGSLSADVAIGLLPLGTGQLSAPVPTGFTFLGAVLVDLVGASFVQPALLSIPRPGGLDAAAQVVVAQIISDPSGGRRLRLVGLGEIGPLRISIQTTLGALSFPGVRSGGEYVFLHAIQPLGFITGLITAFGGSFQPLALVTADTAPFAVVTDASGAFIVGGRAGVSTNVTALEPAGGSASGAAAIAALNDVATLNLSVVQTAPAVTATIPAPNAVNVALATPIVVDFSKAIDPVTVTTGSAVLSAGPNVIATQLVMSANRRRLTMTPALPLAGLTAHTLTLTTAIRDGAGVPLAPFTPLTFTTLDPSKATILAVGVIVAELPDEDEMSLITGAPGAAEPGSAVVATNLRTQETVTVLALADGSFRLRVTVVIGDEIALTLRDASGRETTLTITQFTGADGSASIGSSGGTILGAAGRSGRVLPRALNSAGVFHLTDAGEAQLPALPSSFALVDRFALAIEGASFRSLDSITLTESQGRFAAATSFSSPFATAADLTVPSDFLITASLRFTAAVSDRDGTRRSASGVTVVVAGGPDTAAVESGFGDEFPTVFLTAPKQAIPTQVVEVSAIAPAARIDIDVPTTAAVNSGESFVLARLTDVGGVPKLAVVDRLDRVEVNGTARLRTVGRNLPGASRPGEYVAVSGPFAFVTGRASGPAAVVTVDGSPFVFETGAANGAFAVPVAAGAAFTLRFVDAATGAALGSTIGQAPAAGASADVGSPLASPTGVLTVTAQPDAQSVVDIGTPLVFTFSEALDRASVVPNAFVVTDAAGARAFGRIALSTDARTVTFEPLRRWKFGARYRYGVATNVIGVSGARLAQSFSGEFVTFAPRLVGVLPLSGARDVAVAGTLGIVATGEGATVVDVTRPDAPAPLGNIVLTGGGRAVGVLTTPLTGRNGQATPVPVAVIGSGDTASPGLVHSYSLAVPTSPVLLGSSQLSTPGGQTAPPGVPDGPGIPNALDVDASGRALVAVRDLGLVSVALGTAVPNAPSTPGLALGARFPATGAGDALQSARVGGRIAVVGQAGLTILDGTSLEVIHAAASADPLVAVGALTTFAFDVTGEGDGADAEGIDVVVAGDQAGLIHLYRLSSDGVPQLISVVRLPSPSSVGGVVVNAAERLAYVGAGGRGVALVDLSGPASIQPVDIDRDGIDDRILGFVGTPGAAGRIHLDLSRGMAYVADSVGLSTLQIIPPRVRFLSLRRDPVRGRSGDEETLSPAVAAYVTDEAIVAEVEAAVPAGHTVSVAIEEAVSAANPRTLAFANGASTVQVAPGQSVVVARIARGGVGSEATFVARDALGATLARQNFRLVEPPVDPDLTSIFVEPEIVELTDVIDRAALSVGGVLADGRVLNVTLAASQTRYVSGDTHVVRVNPDGEVSAGGGGRIEVDIYNRALSTGVAILVNRTATLTELLVDSPFVTLITPEPQALRFAARFSDGSQQPAADVSGTTFSTSAPGVVTVDAAGRVTAISDGVATIRALNGTLEALMQVHVELRGASSVSSIDLASFTTSVSTDDSQVVANARLVGTGALHGLVVTYSVSAGGQSQAITGAAGLASAILGGLTVPGTVTITASVQDPATGAIRTDAEQLLVLPGTSDTEPNGSDASASMLGSGQTAIGALTVGTDAQDIFKVDATVTGTLTVTLELLGGTSPSAVVIVVRDLNGTELGRSPPAGASGELSVVIPAGGAFVTLELAGESAQYSLRSKVEQGPVVIDAVQPSGGATGTAVVITGSGFSSRASDNAVFFGTVRGKLVASSPTRLDVLVPANAVDAPLRVVARARAATGPVFVVGRSGPLASSFSRPSDPAKRRSDPISGAVVDVSRVWVDFDPVTARDRVDQIAVAVGGSVAGFLPMLNRYIIEVGSSDTLGGLRTLQASISVFPEVLNVSLVDFPKAQADRRIDARDRSGNWWNETARSEPYERINLFEAIEAIRRTEPFRNPLNLHKVRVAIIDSGFDPQLGSEFSGPQTVLEKASSGGFVALSLKDDITGHGTLVTGVVTALNDESLASGVLGSLFRTDEQLQASVFVETIVYGCGNGDGTMDGGCISEALQDVASRGNIDVVNMSLSSRDYETSRAGPGCPNEGGTYSGAAKRCEYFKLIQPLIGRTLVVASAGNDGVEAGNTFPAMSERDLANVLTVAAVAVSDSDATGEKADRRASFGLLSRSRFHPAEISCSATPDPIGGTAASNCGPGVSVAAPGEDFFVPKAKNTFGVDHDVFQGTSAAAPLVTGVAAMLQAIRPSAAIITPDILKDVLITTADDISSTWQTRRNEPMRRVNALAAVREILPAATQQRILVTDHPEGEETGLVVALNVDPLTGSVSGPATEIVLRFTKGSATVKGRRPTAIVTPTPGDWAFVLAETDQAGGDGLFVIDTSEMAIENFIPLTGQQFPPATTALPAIAVHLSNKASMVATRSGRVLFVSAGHRIIVVDTLTHRVVDNLNELTWSQNVVRPIPSTYLFLRDADIQQRVQAADGEITSLSLSPDDRSLYALVRTGGGTEFQPGFLMEINVALDIDKNPLTTALEPDLGSFFALKDDGTRLEGHDEPSAVAAAPDGKHVYVTNGGVQAFFAVLPESLGILTSLQVFAANMFSAPSIAPTVADLAKRDGYTQLLAAGRVQAFDVTGGSIGTEVWDFPSELSAAWTPTAPVISDQLIRRQVNSERTFGMAFKRGGARAIVPFFQTGNFGVLDLDRQAAQPQRAPVGVFQGLVAVTPSLDLDLSLWPPPEQEARLYPTKVTYAQNGRFAVGVHTGVHGGAVTVLDDELITADLTAHVGQSIETSDAEEPVPFFSVRPLCADRADPVALTCRRDVFTTFTEYQTSSGSGAATFTRPRDVAIQPFLNIVTPGFSDRIDLATVMLFSWRDGRAASFVTSLFDLGVEGSVNVTPVLVGPPVRRVLTTAQRNKQYVADDLKALFPSSTILDRNHRYRIEILLETNTGDELATEIVEVVFNQ